MKTILFYQLYEKVNPILWNKNGQQPSYLRYFMGHFFCRLNSNGENIWEKH